MMRQGLPCPLSRDIYIQNTGWESQAIAMETFPEAAALAVISVRPAAREALGDPETLIEDLTIANNQIYGDMIASRTATAARLACTECTGIVVDQSNGRMYCGREVPQTVLDTNRRIGES